MKELYLDAEMEVVKFTACDVIATSATTVTTTAESMGPTDDDAWADLELTPSIGAPRSYDRGAFFRSYLGDLLCIMN